MKENKKAAVLMSGGVDSAVAALLMKERGFDVEGFYMDADCFSQDAAGRAKKVADFLGIKLNIVDVSREFKKYVVDYFISEYRNLRTPNPCVACNRFIKFGILYGEIRKRGIETIVTGHYINKIQETRYPPKWRAGKIQETRKYQISNIKENLKLEEYGLKVALDKKKDQSYFLYNLTQEHLKHLEFPLGGLMKDEVWKIAKKNNLPVPENESQDICFLRGDHNKYLEKYLDLKRGPIVDKSGKVLGEHFGLPLYAPGQRRWIKIGGDGPYYVLKSDIETNSLYVADRFDDPELYRDEFEVEEVNWISESSKFKVPSNTAGRQSSKFARVKIRYLHPAVKVDSIKEIEGGNLRVKLKEKQRAVTSGQSAAFYSGGELLGGGIIQI